MPDTFTPEQISQILEEFFKVVGTRQYIGARYVPIFGRKGEPSIEWDNTAPYEPLTIVLYQGNSYTSRQFVPVGVEITNQEFWAITGNYNAQVEMYRRETAAAREIAEAAQNDIDTLLPKADFSAENTVKDYVDAARAVAEAAQNDIDTLLPKADFSAENTVKQYIDLNKTRVLSFNTVADMQASTSLVAGMTCHTNGFHSFGDDGAAYYTISESGTANGMDVLALQNGLFATLVVTEPYITPEQFGAWGDGTHDDYAAIQKILTTLNTIGGILFIPAGTYNISKSLTVGSNTVVLGVGAKSYINLTQSTNLMGTAIAVAGSNVIIDSISGGYVDDDRPFNTTGTNMGFIGIGSYTFDSCKSLNEGEIGVDGLVGTDYHNVTVCNLYCESAYPLQTEPAKNGTIDGVTYDKIVCPYGVVSMYSNYDGAIKNAVINDVKCAFMRIGTGYDKSFINVSNVYCNNLHSSSRKVNYNNIVVRYDKDSVVRDWVESGTFTYTELFWMQDSNLNNCIIDACDTDIVGLRTMSAANNDSRYNHITNVVVKGVNSASNAAVIIGGDDTYRCAICTNCDFSQNETAGNVLNGVFIGCNLGEVNTSYSNIYSDTHERLITLTWASGIGSLSASDNVAYSTYTYDKVHLKGSLYPTSGNLANNMELFTINARHAPSVAQTVHGLAWSSTDNSFSPCVINIDTNGLAKIGMLLKPGTYDRLTIDDEYVVGVLDR